MSGGAYGTTAGLYGASAGAYGGGAAGYGGGAAGYGGGATGYGGGAAAYGGAAAAYGFGAGAVPSGSPAHWGWRVLASVLDGTFVSVPYLVAFGYAQTTATLGVDAAGFPVSVPTAEGQLAVVVGVLVMWVLLFVNRVVLQGRTGQSWGKRIVGLRAVHEDTEEPLGMWWAFVRDVANVVNSLPLYLGYLWPLWDARRQTFSDKLAHCVVLRDPR